MALRLSSLLLAALGLLGQGDAGAAPPDPLARGRSLYLNGRDLDGTPLTASRAGGLGVKGAEAACANCHRPSGLGSAEGRSYIPPIDGASLAADRPPGTGPSAAGNGRPAYGERSLIRAIRQGVDAGGRPLDYLMPRYALTDAQARALAAYLGRLSVLPAPGIGPDRVDFAAVVAPGVSPARREAMAGVLQACFDEYNAGPTPSRARMRTAGAMGWQPRRPWRLHLWQLEGPPESWAGQLAEYRGRQPVFALVGGVGSGQWAPIQAFCEEQGLPCLFPHLEAPPAGQPGFHALYLSRGVVLEAGLMARHIAEASPPRVIQVFREVDEAARAGADELARRLAARGIPAASRPLGPGEPLNPALLRTDAGEVLALWLRESDLERLAAVPPALAYVSATLAGPEAAALPAPWRAGTLMAYPYELPGKREKATAAFRNWLRERGLPPTDEAVQADAYLACRALALGMNEVAERPLGDFLVERIEMAVGRALLPGPYPRLSLGPGQRFAAKTGYLVRLDPEEPSGIAPVGEAFAP